MKGRHILFDMDGTLFDHNGALRRDMLKISSPEDIEAYNLDKIEDFWGLEDQPFMKARIDMIRRQPGWWRNLPRWEPGWEIFEIAVKVIGFCPIILTKGPKRVNQWHGWKVQCIHDHFGEDMPIDIVGKSKGRTYGRVLVDDYPDYLKAWLKWRPRGLAIMPAQPYNADFAHDNVIRYTDNIEEVKHALRAAYNRESKQHWRECL